MNGRLAMCRANQRVAEWSRGMVDEELAIPKSATILHTNSNNNNTNLSLFSSSETDSPTKTHTPAQSHKHRHADLDARHHVSYPRLFEAEQRTAAQAFAKILAELQTDTREGLTSAEALARQKTYGANDVSMESSSVAARRAAASRVMIRSQPSFVAILAGAVMGLGQWLGACVASKYAQQFQDPLIVLLLVSAGVSLLMGQIENCISIAVTVLIVGTVAFIQEHRTERSLQALNKLAPPRCRVLRDGHLSDRLASDLVPGDVVELHTGDRVPADIILFAAVDVEVDESMLTGESRAVKKRALSGRADAAEDGSPVDYTALSDVPELIGLFEWVGRNRGGAGRIGGAGKIGSVGGVGSLGKMSGAAKTGGAGKTGVIDRIELVDLQSDIQPSKSVDKTHNTTSVDKTHNTTSVDKIHNTIQNTPTMPRIQDTLVLMATLIAQGNGRGIVFATGPETRFGRMYSLVKQTTEKRSPLQCHLDLLGKQLSLYSLAVIVVISCFGVWQRQPILQVFTVAVSLAVAAIPEGLPIVATITLALGVLRLSRKNVIVRRLPAVEALGSVDVLCVDKTGTLTMNELRVQTIYSCETACEFAAAEAGAIWRRHARADLLKTALYLCNNCERGIEGDWLGTPVDVAIRRFLQSAEPHGHETAYRRVEEVSFTSERRFMAVKCQRVGTGETIYCVKGAVERLFSMCQETRFLDRVHAMCSSGLRVLAVAIGSDTSNLRIVGLVGMCDPPRADIQQTLTHLRSCGIRCVMVTGDARDTALALATQIRWQHNGPESICSGDELEEMTGGGTDAGIATGAAGAAGIERLSIVYRATPEHKLILVDRLQRARHVVAMTGDGVNDAPALKMADIGVALGRSGTDVARAAAQVILTDDRLASLVDGIEEGKAIFSNIRSFLRFQLSTSLAALALIAAAMLTDSTRGSPMNPMQILLINIIMDGPPAQSLGVEPVSRDALRRPPRPRSAPILSAALLFRTALSSTHIVLGTFLVMRWEQRTHPADSTRTFAVFVLFSIANAFACRSTHRSLLALGPFTNRFLTVSAAISLCTLLAIVSIPALGALFKTHSMSLHDWAILLATASTLLLLDELLKVLLRLYRPSRVLLPTEDLEGQPCDPLLVHTKT